jgi:hypothetical protein
MKQRQPKVVPDIAHRGMTRVRWPDGRLSDMTNLTRAKDAVACLIETEERRQRGRTDLQKAAGTSKLGTGMSDNAD